MRLIDWSVIALYLTAMLVLAGWLGRRQRRGVFTTGKRPVVLFSTLATQRRTVAAAGCCSGGGCSVARIGGTPTAALIFPLFLAPKGVVSYEILTAPGRESECWQAASCCFAVDMCIYRYVDPAVARSLLLRLLLMVLCCMTFGGARVDRDLLHWYFLSPCFLVCCYWVMRRTGHSLRLPSARW